MIARLLHLCGLNLGPADELLPPQADNPEGFWENRHLVAASDEALTALGGAWCAPPVYEPSRLSACRAVVPIWAEPWGWKDPRAVLLAPWWTEQIPDVRWVVCVRHPLEVAQSLVDRDRFFYRQALDLWRHYAQAALALPAAQRIVTHYAAYFADAATEVRRVTAALGWRVNDEQMQAGCATIQTGLRHTHVAASLTTALPADVRELYAQLCALADVSEPPAERSRYAQAVQHALQVEAEVLAQRTRLAQLEAALAEQTALATALADKLRWRRYQLADRVAGWYQRVRGLVGHAP
jgi:hypothetical protein